MKTLKSTLALILLAAILVSSFCFPACAASAQSITYLEDGSYYITTITVFPSAQNGRAASSISGQKTRDYYSSSHEKLYSLSVIGHFTYTGNTATATNADYDYSVQVSTWSFVLGNGERNVPPPDRNRSRLRDPHLFGGRQAFVIPFSLNIRTRAHRNSVRGFPFTGIYL